MQRSQEKIHDHVEEIVLVRHGLTARNEGHRIGKFISSRVELAKVGVLPDHEVSLAERGKVQAKLIGKVLSRMRPDLRELHRFFDSGYLRTIQTLDRILRAFQLDTEAGGRRRHHLDLREREPGYPFNMTITEANQFFPWYPEYARIVGEFFERPPGGESIADVCSRVHMFLTSLRRAHSGRRVMVVAHGGVILAFKFWLEKRNVQEAEQLFKESVDNCQALIYRRVKGKGQYKFDHDPSEARVRECFVKLMDQWEKENVKRDDEANPADLDETTAG